MILAKSFLIILIFSSISCIKKGAKAIYSHLDVSKTSKKFDTYVIDFKSDKTPAATYWALANWQMDITEFSKLHPDAKIAGAYAGLQTQYNGTKQAIMSFWDVFYTENGVEKRNRAKRIYPPGEQSIFTNEGEGTNFFPQYRWLTNVWYRFVIHSWVDSTSKTTYVGEWIQNLDTNVWTLLTYFDVGLKESFLLGDFSFFIENYNSDFFGLERTFQLKNMYTFDHSYKKWISMNTSTLYSEHHENSQGTHEFGYTSSYFYGSCGLPVNNQELYDASMPEVITGTINQPNEPKFLKSQFKSVTDNLTRNLLTLNWVLDETRPPCFTYNFSYSRKNSKGVYELIEDFNVDKPETTTFTFVRYFSGQYAIKIQCTSIFHISTVYTIYRTYE